VWTAVPSGLQLRFPGRKREDASSLVFVTNIGSCDCLCPLACAGTGMITLCPNFGGSQLTLGRHTLIC
jgi:hypothetical protein